MSYIGQPLVNSDLQMWTFVGDGSDMTFTLTNFPVSERSTGAKDLMVQIDGIMQTPTTAYTFNNTTQELIFTSPPPLNTAIIIRVHVVL
jgi:hypothetical protein